MTERLKLIIKKPLNLEKKSQLFQALKPLQANTEKEQHQQIQQQKQKEKEDKQKKKKEIKSALAWLYEHFPDGFNLDNIKPLKLHIDKDIYPYLKQEGAPSKIKIRFALKYYTHNLDYLKALINGTHRYDLKGQQVEKVTQEQKDFAQDKLEEISNNIKAKKQHKNKNFNQEKTDNS